jgi:NADH:ubiquinone oxidoreductase subunit 6 (subunit J)
MRRSQADLFLGLFAFLSSVLIALNVITDRSNFWAIWPIWALGMVTAGLVLASTLRPHRLLGVWAGTGGVIIVGLFVLDLTNGGNWWFFWPMAAWIVIGLVITGLTVDLLSSIPTSEPADDNALPPGATSLPDDTQR